MIRNCLFLAAALITTVASSMELGSLSAAQHISLLRSFLTVTDFRVTKEGKVTYPHYQDKTQVFIQDRHDATLILWQAKDDTTIMNKGGSLTLELYSRLDRSQPLEPQLSDTEKLSLHQFLFHRFFARKDIDRDDDIAITPQGARIITTAQQKHARSSKKSLGRFSYGTIRIIWHKNPCYS